MVSTFNDIGGGIDLPIIEEIPQYVLSISLQRSLIIIVRKPLPEQFEVETLLMQLNNNEMSQLY